MTNFIYDGLEIEISPPTLWPIEWITFRCHPCTDWTGVFKYTSGALQDAPIVVCRSCFVVLDGWHRLASHWLKGERYIEVCFTDTHLNNAPDACHVDKVNWLDTIRPWTALDCVSGSYLKQDFLSRTFAALTFQLRHAGDDKMPQMRLWEHARVVAFLGVVSGLTILDVGTRESILPAFLAAQGAQVTAIDMDTSQIAPCAGVTIEQADARELPYANESFDFVVSTACVKLIDRDTQAMQEMFRVLKPHGRLAVTFDFGQEYAEFPSKATGRRIYDKTAIYERLVKPLGKEAHLCGPADFDRSDWNDWPIAIQAPTVFEAGVNVQVAFILLRKIPGGV